jgi:hypothetical protein
MIYTVSIWDELVCYNHSISRSLLNKLDMEDKFGIDHKLTCALGNYLHIRALYQISRIRFCRS